MYQVFGVAPGGLVDVSADGKLAVDSLIQVFDLQTGAQRASFDCYQPLLPSGDNVRQLIRLTADGR